MSYFKGKKIFLSTWCFAHGILRRFTLASQWSKDVFSFNHPRELKEFIPSQQSYVSRFLVIPSFRQAIRLVTFCQSFFKEYINCYFAYLNYLPYRDFQEVINDQFTANEFLTYKTRAFSVLLKKISFCHQQQKMLSVKAITIFLCFNVIPDGYGILLQYYVKLNLTLGEKFLPLRVVDYF